MTLAPNAPAGVADRSAATAMARSALSKPVQFALDDGVLGPGRAVFDYGCGRGGDVARLRRAGFDAAGWDPAHAPDRPIRAADIVNLGYVINVIERPAERVEAIRRAWALARRVLVVAARPEWEAATVTCRPHGDGVVTSKGTFQRFYAQDELRDLLQAVAGVEPVAATPGIFYLFRDPADAASVRARRFRPRRLVLPRVRHADRLWDTHRAGFEAFVGFWQDRGRLPDPGEVAILGTEAAALVNDVGSVRTAAAVAKRVVDPEVFEAATARARDDLLVFLALEAFSGRPKLSDLPDDIIIDVRAMFGTYKAACAAGDALLFGLADDAALDSALRSLPFGKVLPDAAYVHASYLHLLAPLARAYEGAGRAVVGAVDDANLVKLSRRERRISYLSYPAFERDPHPPLATSLRVDLRSFHVKWRDYRASTNPPVLHRKDTFVPVEHPTRSKFERLTMQEERAGVLANTATIGTRADRKILARRAKVPRQEAAQADKPPPLSHQRAPGVRETPGPSRHFRPWATSS